MEQGMDAHAAPGGRTRMRRVLRALLGLVIVVAVLAAALIAGMLIANRKDQPLSAEARALDALVASARRPAPADDAAAGLAALGAVSVGDASDPMAAIKAAERDEAMRRASRGGRLDDALDACAQRPITADCARRLADTEADIPAWVARERAMFDAYRRVLSRRGWYEPPPPADPAGWMPPPVQPAFEGQFLLLAQAMVDASAGRAGEVRSALDADAAFWRAGLARAPTLIAKMVAARALQRNFDLGALALQRLPQAALGAAIPPSWTRELTPEERSLLRALAWEWKLTSNFTHAQFDEAQYELRRKYDTGNPTLRPLFKPQATSNGSARLMHRIVRANAAPYPRLKAAQRELYAEVERESRFPISIYNPVGRILGSIAAPGYTDYGSRIADLEARRRAALAAVELHRRGIASSAAAAALADVPLRNPYTGRAFEWSESASCIRIGGIGRVDGDGCVSYVPPP